MSYIQTSTGKAFDFLDPRPEMVDIVDIAHALARIGRYTGHCKHFYSVGRHSWLCSYAVDDSDASGRAVAYRALLHDAAEAYIGDVTSPLKMLLPDYREIEDRVTAVVRKALGIVDDAELDAYVKTIDIRMLETERPLLLGDNCDRPWRMPLPGYGLDLKANLDDPHSQQTLLATMTGASPETVTDDFLSRYHFLRPS